MENGEKCTFCTYDDQHGDHHRASHDVTKIKFPCFVKVAFSTRNMATSIPYKSEAVKGLKHSSPLPIFSLTRIQPHLLGIQGFATLYIEVEFHILRYPRLVELKSYIHIFERFNSSHRRVITLRLLLSLYHFILEHFQFYLASIYFPVQVFLRFIFVPDSRLRLEQVLIIISFIYLFCLFTSYYQYFFLYSFTLYARYFYCLTLNSKLNLFHYMFRILID